MQRNILIIFGVCVALILAGAYLLFYTPSSVSTPATGTQGAAATAGGEISFSIVKEGTMAVNQPARKNYRITNSSELASAWANLYGKGSTPPATIDFTRQEVLIVLDGEHPTGGYDVDVSSIMDGNGTRIVAITHTVPGKSCITTQAKTSPFQVVIVPTTQNTLTHTDQTVTVACK